MSLPTVDEYLDQYPDCLKGWAGALKEKYTDFRERSQCVLTVNIRDYRLFVAFYRIAGSGVIYFIQKNGQAVARTSKDALPHGEQIEEEDKRLCYDAYTPKGKKLLLLI